MNLLAGSAIDNSNNSNTSNNWFSSLGGRSGSAAISNIGSSFVRFANNTTSDLSQAVRNMSTGASAHTNPGNAGNIPPILGQSNQILGNSSGDVHAEDQGRALEEALNVAKVQGFHMKKCLESNKLMDALKHASTMLTELRTSALTPKNYYELYMYIFDQLRHLTSFLYDSHVQKKHHLSDLYELVQYAGNVVPRLYLMITVGSVYMRVAKEQTSTPRSPTGSITNAVKDTSLEDTSKWDEDVPPIRELMKDMLEMSRGVQHPTRGLFLRHYLSQMTRDYLPDGTIDGPHGNLQDSIEFTLSNFIEMNKLWVRLQYQGPSREREKREQERKELRQLVGNNLVRLSQLDGVDLDAYSKRILPAILDEIVSCRDVLAQEYLMEVIIQVFHDDLHIRTLDQFLAATAQLSRDVNVKQTVISLVDRFAQYAARSREEEEGRRKELLRQAASQGPEKLAELEQEFADQPASGVPDDVELFEVFWGQIAELVKARPEFTISDIVGLLRALLDLTLNCYPDRIDNVDKVLGLTKDAVASALAAKSPDVHGPSTTNVLLQILLAPIHAYSNNILDMIHFPSSSTQPPPSPQPQAIQYASDGVTPLPQPPPPRQSPYLAGNYTELLFLQQFPIRRKVAHVAADTLLQNDTHLSSPVAIQLIFGELCQCMILDQRDGGLFGEALPDGRLPQPGKGPLDWDDVEEEQTKVAKLAHLVRFVPEEDDEDEPVVADPIKADQILLQTLRRHLAASGDLRMRYTLPSLAMESLRLASQIPEEDESLATVYKFCFETITALDDCGETVDQESGQKLDALVNPHDMSFRLFCHAAKSAIHRKQLDVAFDLFVEAMTVFEDSIARGQARALTVLVPSLLEAKGVLDEESYETLAGKCKAYATRMLRKSDQVKSLLLVSQLYDGTRTLECLQRSIKIAGSVMDVASRVELLEEVLEKMIWYFGKDLQEVTPEMISTLVNVINTTISKQASQTGTGDGLSFERLGAKTIPSQTLEAYRNTLSYLSMRQSESKRTEQGRWKDIHVDSS